MRSSLILRRLQQYTYCQIAYCENGRASCGSGKKFNSYRSNCYLLFSRIFKWYAVDIPAITIQAENLINYWLIKLLFKYRLQINYFSHSASVKILLKYLNYLFLFVIIILSSQNTIQLIFDRLVYNSFLTQIICKINVSRIYL